MKEIDNDVMNFMVDYANTAKEAQSSSRLLSEASSMGISGNKEFQIM